MSLEFYPKSAKIATICFHDKTRKSLFVCFQYLFKLSVGGKITPMKWFFTNAYVTLKKFTPDLQIFYTFPVVGLNVCSCWG